jgi:hypothetical protein
MDQVVGQRGLVVIGVHTPEFAFERDAANVLKASVSLGVGYPVVIDNDFAIWRAFDNQAWPAIYFIGADGRVRHHTLGEGGYDQSERLIQQLLSETNGAPVTKDMQAFAQKVRRPRRTRQSAFIRNLHRLPAGRKFRVSRRHQAGCSQPLSRYDGVAAQPMESGGRLDRRSRVRLAQRGARQHRLSFSRPRSSPRLGRFHARPAGSLPS